MTLRVGLDLPTLVTPLSIHVHVRHVYVARTADGRSGAALHVSYVDAHSARFLGRLAYARDAGHPSYQIWYPLRCP